MGPLESTKFYILLALAVEAQNGASIRRQITGDTLGTYLRDGTLYEALASMVKAGLIERLPGGKTYQLTERGRRRLELESRTLRRAAELSQIRLGWK